MKSKTFATISLMSALALTFIALAIALTLSAEKNTATVRGYILDSACAFTKNLDKPVSRKCALACARAGSPLVILADDGNIYWPISNSTPAAGQNPKLLKFAGERVTATGKTFERGGSRDIVIEKIAPEPKKYLYHHSTKSRTTGLQNNQG